MISRGQNSVDFSYLYGQEKSRRGNKSMEKQSVQLHRSNGQTVVWGRGE